MAADDGVDRILCLTGPESTGKTTLAQQLMEQLGGVVVPEVARDVLTGRTGYQREDLLEIVRLQIAAEHRAREQHSGLLICDTDLLVLQIWWREKYGPLPGLLSDALRRRSTRGYLLLAPDLPWASDPLRENPSDRDRLFGLYQAELAGSSFPHRIVTGEGSGRVECALLAAEEILVELRSPGMARG